MLKRALSFFLIILSIQNAWSQSSEIDSLKTLIENSTSDTARIRLSIKYASELTYNNQKESKIILEDCIRESRELGYRIGEANALYAKAVSLAMEGQYETSLKCMIESSSIYQQIGNKTGYAKCLGGQGNIYYFMSNLKKAQSYYEDALKIYKQENNYIGIASCISNLGLVCQSLNNFDKALEYQFEGLKLEEKAGNKRGIAISHISISSIFLDLKRFPEAKKHALISIIYSKSIADSNAISEGMLRLADCYLLTNQFDSVQYYLNETTRICEKSRDLHQLVKALVVQTNLYDSIGNFNKAYQTQKQLLIVKDSLLNKENTDKLVEMQIKFDTEKKEKENLLLLSKFFKQKIFLWGLLLIITFICLITIQIFLSKKKLRVSLENLLILHQEVNQQKEEIETQAESLENANEAIIAQKNQIETTYQKITDSIVYASFIQSAMLPSNEILNNFTADNFILYKPRDVVSGDFYWYKEKNGNYLLAVADCTGHGVPGALLSMMGISFLNDIVANNSEVKVSTILEELRLNVKLALGQFSNQSLRKEGIEIGIISYNPKLRVVSFSGANLSIWLNRSGKIKEYKSDKMPIGVSLKEKPFSNVEFTIEPDDTIYMFTDGYSDQLGGVYGKKFLRRNFIHLLATNSQLPLKEQKAHLFKTHLEWKGDKFDQIDDILVVGLKF